MKETIMIEKNTLKNLSKTTTSLQKPKFLSKMDQKTIMQAVSTVLNA